MFPAGTFLFWLHPAGTTYLNSLREIIFLVAPCGHYLSHVPCGNFFFLVALCEDFLYIMFPAGTFFFWLREPDLNRQPSGYEPDELPTAPSRVNLKQLLYIVYYFSCSAILNGGGRRIRTFEVVDNRFTVCPLWPLGYPSA